MNPVRRIADHLVRVQRQFGKGIALGQKRYAVKGYISNILSVQTGAEWEPELNRVLAEVLEAPGYFIDVGMNLGQTLGKVLAIDPDRHYLGFEPQTFACAMVDQFIRQNRLKNCTTLPIGLSNQNEVMSFFGTGGADTMASLLPKEDADRTSIVVRIGDEVIRELGIEEICAIKIDVEGAESVVLEGLSDTIRKMRPPILFEVIPCYRGEARIPVAAAVAERRRKGASEILRLFGELEYVIEQILPDATTRPIQSFDLDDPAKFAGTNYVARPA